ncbi:class I adenylate-forming enzyme family protein [Rhodococcus aetherivorans]|uniref:class I adenylate-forming enzyme family protein n=1 Tax=Rhodococcus aetherivorans TaxID=191292 RepID=UPI00241E44BD|nr:fatty acid--CoA ligase family protein [Rhodococcus aetherivorans]WFS11086.1 fatty acid--CoA ligase family protein [Rhodococcus aetherivorans]
MASIREAMAALWSAPDEANMIQQEGHWIPWGRVRILAERIDAELTRTGCGEGSRIGVVLGNRVESIAAMIAVLGKGRTSITLNPMQPVARLTADMVAALPQVVLAPGSMWSEDEFTTAAQESGIVGFAIDGIEVDQRSGGSEVGIETDRDEQDPVAVEMFTSGTTGPPKRIKLRWRQLESAMVAVHGHTGVGGEERAPLTGRVALVTLPIVHIGGLWAVLQNLAEARPFVLLPRFTVDGWVQAVHEHKAKVAGLPPAAMRSVLSAEVPPEKLVSLRAVTAGTTFVSPDLADEFTSRYGIPVLIMYGATEFAGAVAGWSKPLHTEWWAAKRGSVGRAFPGVQLRTVDEDGNVLPVGESGRLEVSAKQVGTGTDQWMRTSDLARIDEDGFLYIEGRADDAIIRGGFKVHPETVCNALRAHPSVLDATVFGKDDERLGKVPIAVVELVDGAVPVAEDELKDFVRGQLTAYEVPVTVHTVDELPRGVSMKIDRRRLLEMVAGLENVAGLEDAAAAV